MTKTGPGRYYGRDWRGRLVDLGRFPEGPAPDVVICRRVADYPEGKPIPPGGAVGRCAECDAAIVYNTAGPHQDRARVCMQCAGIRPLPFETEP